MTSHRSALKQDFYAVREVLRTLWNPVGVEGLPEDEYDSDIWPIVRLLKEGVGEPALAQHLHQVEQVYFGWDTSEARLKPVTCALLALGVKRGGESLQ